MNSQATFRWMLHATQGIRCALVGNMLLGIVQVGLSLLFVYLCKALIDGATGVKAVDYEAYILLLVVCCLGQLGGTFLRNQLSNYTHIRLKTQLQGRLFAHLTRLPYLSLCRRHTGDLTNRLEEDVRVIADTLSHTLPSLLPTGLQFLAAFGFLLLMDMRLAGLILLIMPLFLLAGKYLSHRMRTLTRIIRESDGKVQSFLQESLQHVLLLQTMEQEGKAASRLDDLQSDLQGQVMRRSRFTAYSRLFLSAAFTLSYLAAFLWGVAGIRNGSITFGMMTAFLQLVGQIQRPLVGMSQQFPSLLHASASVDRLQELEEAEAEDRIEPRPLVAPAGICIQDVTFRYPEGRRDILHHFTYDFPPGSRTAILGKTGAGKSTLFRLILSLLSPVAGRLSLYNHLQQVPVSPATRCNLVYVPQGNSLLSGTIRSNLLVGNPSATEEEIRQALHTAVADFVYALPEGLDSPCQEAGGGLSEGQAQRIAIARALLRKGPILLFDEFSSSLDEETEQLLMQRLTHDFPHKTMLFITHRMAISPYCDRTLTLSGQKTAFPSC